MGWAGTDDEPIRNPTVPNEKAILDHLDSHASNYQQAVGVAGNTIRKVLPYYYEAYGRNCPKKMLSKKKKNSDSDMIFRDLECTEVNVHCVSSEIPNRGSLGRSLSCTSAAACKTPKDGDKVASSELRPPGWCEPTTGKRTMSIGCGFGQLDRFAFDDYSAHLHPYDVEQKDNWTMQGLGTRPAITLFALCSDEKFAFIISFDRSELRK
ncbi:unnamed protein product [Enterobius vermicularis]|uniref:Sema domain-containing protein n=1 Tax=Enterobius vermicularis TaxID=51028 RepID=A0A158Q9D5_ENTVE|nr:unnamed protein product [Enterobius vermicularis]